MSKRPLGGTKRKAIRVSGFRARMRTHSGKKSNYVYVAVRSKIFKYLKIRNLMSFNGIKPIVKSSLPYFIYNFI